MKVQQALASAVAVILTAVLAVSVPPATLANNKPSGLVGHWDFDNGTGKDLSRKGSDAELGGASLYALGAGRDCLMFMPDTEPMRIPASEK